MKRSLSLRWLIANAPLLPLHIRYIVSIGVIVFTSGLLWAVQPFLSTANLAMFYLVAVMICATIGGRGPAIVSAIASFLIFKFLFVAPIFTLTIDDVGDVYQLASLIAAALIGGGLTLYAQSQTAHANQRAHEQAILYELSQTLSRELDIRTIAQAIVETTRTVLPCDYCGLFLQPARDMPPLQIELGDKKSEPVSAPISIRTHQIGSLQVVFAYQQAPLDATNERLINAIAIQAGLAIERSRLIHQLAHTEALAESDRLKSTLLSAVSHDLRTPLATIIAAAEDLSSDDVHWTEAAAHNFASLIGTEAQRLDMLVTNMLDLTRIEAGVLQPRRGWYDIAEIVYRVLDRLERELQDRHVNIQIADELPLVPVDYIQIEQVLWNLLHNATKYSPAGSPLLIRANIHDPWLCLEIGDQGSGIPSESRARIFEKFARLPEHEHQGIPGAGVGLTICKGIIEAHGGRIAIAGCESGGTLITIHLPNTLEPPDAPAPSGIEQALR